MGTVTCHGNDTKERHTDVCRKKNTNSASVNMQHTDNLFVYVPQYIILSINISETSYIHKFLSFQDGDILRKSYTEFITKFCLYFIY